MFVCILSDFVWWMHHAALAVYSHFTLLINAVCYVFYTISKEVSTDKMVTVDSEITKIYY